MKNKNKPLILKVFYLILLLQIILTYSVKGQISAGGTSTPTSAGASIMPKMVLKKRLKTANKQIGSKVTKSNTNTISKPTVASSKKPTKTKSSSNSKSVKSDKDYEPIKIDDSASNNSSNSMHKTAIVGSWKRESFYGVVIFKFFSNGNYEYYRILSDNTISELGVYQISGNEITLVPDNRSYQPYKHSWFVGKTRFTGYPPNCLHISNPSTPSDPWDVYIPEK
jgi:hypothetical protein